MIGAANDDHLGEAAIELALVGDVGRKIGIGPVRLQERAIDIVAEGRGAEQGLLAILPILVLLALRRRQPALVDVAAARKVSIVLLTRSTGLLERPLREKHIVVDAQKVEIRPDEVHHGSHCSSADNGKPFAFRLGEKRRPIALSQGGANRPQVVARIEALGDLDRLPERFPVAQEGGAAENVDLSAGIVDVVFARHVVAAESEQ